MAGQSKKVALYFLGIVAALGIFGGMYYYTWYTDGLKVSPPDYCPTDTYAQRKAGIEVPGHTAILIDTSNRIAEEDAALAFERIGDWSRDSAPFLQRLTIYGLPESAADGAPNNHGSWCIPKDGDDANRIYENPAFVESEFKRFLATAEDIFEELVDREESAESPIAETMAELVQRNEDLDSIILVSDMLQNTASWSFYTGERDSLAFERVCGRITNSGRLKTVFVYYIDREHVESQAPEWPDTFWRACLGEVRAAML